MKRRGTEGTKWTQETGCVRLAMTLVRCAPRRGRGGCVFWLLVGFSVAGAGVWLFNFLKGVL